MSENVYEEQARARKVAALNGWIMAAMLNMRDISPIEAADACVRFVDNANDAAWEQAASACGVNVPSEQTKAVLRAQFVAQRDALVSMPDDIFEGIGA